MNSWNCQMMQGNTLFRKLETLVLCQKRGFSSICDIWDYYEVFQGKKSYDFTWEEESKLIIDFCETYQLYLYEKPRESFFQYEAISYAKEHGYKGVILSDLS